MDYSLRIGGFVATLVTSCALATLHFSSNGFNESAGGVIGRIVGEWLESVMKLLGASTLLFVIWVASISLFLGISWFQRHGTRSAAGAWSAMSVRDSRLVSGRTRPKADVNRPHVRMSSETEKKRTAGRKRPRIEPVIASPGNKRQGRKRAPGAVVRSTGCRRAATIVIT